MVSEGGLKFVQCRRQTVRIAEPSFSPALPAGYLPLGMCLEDSIGVQIKMGNLQASEITSWPLMGTLSTRCITFLQSKRLSKSFRSNDSSHTNTL